METKTVKKRQKRGLATEDKVLATTERLMRENGFEAAQIENITKESGVSVGSFYHHFGSKEGVIKRLVDRFCQEGKDDLAGLELDSLPPREGLRAVLGATLRRFRRNPELYRTMAAKMEAEPEIWQPMRALRFEHEDILFAHIGQWLGNNGAANPNETIGRAMQIVLALLTHIAVFDSGPSKLYSDEIEEQIFRLALSSFAMDMHPSRQDQFS